MKFVSVNYTVYLDIQMMLHLYDDFISSVNLSFYIQVLASTNSEPINYNICLNPFIVI